MPFDPHSLESSSGVWVNFYPKDGRERSRMPSSWDANKNSTQREGVPRGNWIQTDPKKGFFV